MRYFFAQHFLAKIKSTPKGKTISLATSDVMKRQFFTSTISIAAK